MNKKRLWYLSGGMMKFGIENFNESNDWRIDVKIQIGRMSDGQIKSFNPNDHYCATSNPSDYTDLEVMRLDIYKLRQSELIIYNNNDPYSRGSMIELGIGWERGIPIITLNENEQEVHPWVKSMSERIFTDREEMFLYLADHYINID